MRSFLHGILALFLLVAALPALVFASGKNEDFPLQVHVVRQDLASHGMFMEGVGTLHPYTLFIVHIDGDPRELALECLQFNCDPLLGNYKGRWNKSGTLEIQFLDRKGKLKHERFRIQTANPLPAEPPAKQPAK